MGNRGSRPDGSEDYCSSCDDQDLAPATPPCTEADHDAVVGSFALDEFELTGARSFPKDDGDAIPYGDSVLVYEPTVVLVEDAPEPYPEGYELTGAHSVAQDPDDAIFEMELPPYIPEVTAGDLPLTKVDPYDKHAVKQALTKAGPEPASFAVAVHVPRPEYHKGQRKVVTDPTEYLKIYTPVGVIYDAADSRVITNHPIDTPIYAQVDGALVPDPYDKHAPRQGVLYATVVPSRWSDCSSVPKLKDRARTDVFQVKYGDHVAFFRGDDADKVKALLPLHPERTQASVNRDTLIRLRLNLALSNGAPIKDLYAMQQVAGMFHNALETAEDESVASADLEACLEEWVLEPTRYAPFTDLGGAVDFMCLPAHDCRVMGMAIKHRYAPALEPSLMSLKNDDVTNVTSTNMQLRGEPKVEFKRASIWNEPAKHVDDNYRLPLEISGSDF